MKKYIINSSIKEENRRRKNRLLSLKNKEEREKLFYIWVDSGMISYKDFASLSKDFREGKI
jgi:hypothetical protein